MTFSAVEMIFDEVYLCIVGPRGAYVDDDVLNDFYRQTRQYAETLLAETPGLESFRLGEVNDVSSN